MRYSYNIKNLIFLFFAVFLIVSSQFTIASASSLISGQVLDSDENPIIGASVLLMQDETLLLGCMTDSLGKFNLQKLTTDKVAFLKVKALGYANSIREVTDTSFYTIFLQSTLIEVSSIHVSPDNKREPEVSYINKKQFDQRTKYSLVANNPIDAVIAPQVVRHGSSLSSKIRINGTTPEIYFHNLSIGTNPNHYGMFSIIPSSVVDEVEFYTQGTPASYQLSSIIDLKPLQHFNSDNKKSIDVSLVQSTGTLSIGGKDYYALGTVRKSVLDKLVKYFDVKSDRRTVPPTNFEDVVVTSGLKLTNKSSLFVDQMYTRDFLVYNTSPTINNIDGLHTFQHAKTIFTGFTFQHAEKNSIFVLKLNKKYVYEKYEVTPLKNNSGLEIHLRETSDNYSGKSEFTKFLVNSEFKTGIEIQYTTDRNFTLEQAYWNFKSPDATSNNPFVYQSELNQLYNNLSLKLNDLYVATFSQVTHRVKNLEFNFGLRYEQYQNIQDTKQLNFRNRLNYQFGNKSRLSLFFGTFSESPLKNILEDYQVLVRANLSKLKPQRTRLISLSYKKENTTVTLFQKKIYNKAVPFIDFSKIDADNQAVDGFITMQTNGQLHFIGGDISFEKENFIAQGIHLYSFYGYTHAKKTTNSYQSTYELNAPHKFMSELSYQINNQKTIGTKLSYHSGYSYTPYSYNLSTGYENRLQKSYYAQSQSLENTAQFPSFFSLDLFFNYKFTNSEINFAVSNITNRKNPVVLTNDGYIYDAGIMPSIGFKWNL